MKETYFDAARTRADHNTLVAAANALRLNWPHLSDWQRVSLRNDKTNRMFYWQYLQKCGVGKRFSLREIVTPHNRRKAKLVGWREFVPPPFLWPYSAINLRVCNLVREVVNERVALVNHWRPMSYNRLVATSGITSDHPNVGSDIKFSSIADRRKAEGFLRGLCFAMPILEMSVGIGALLLHIAVLSEKGERMWKYASLDRITGKGARRETFQKRWPV